MLIFLVVYREYHTLQWDRHQLRRNGNPEGDAEITLLGKVLRAWVTELGVNIHASIDGQALLHYPMI